MKKNFEDMCNRLDRIPACDRQTDGHLATCQGRQRQHTDLAVSPSPDLVSGISYSTCDSACITDTWTVSKQAEGSTFLLGLRDMTRRVRDCLGC